MREISGLTHLVANKRRRDDIQGQATMKLAEIHRLVTLVAENQFLIEEATLLLGEFLVRRLQRILGGLSNNGRRLLEREWKSAYPGMKRCLQSKSDPADVAAAIEALQQRRRMLIIKFINGESSISSSIEAGAEKVHALRCREGNLFEEFLKSISAKDYADADNEEACKETFVKQLQQLRERCDSMRDNEAAGDLARTGTIEIEMGTHLNQLRLCRGSQAFRMEALSNELMTLLNEEDDELASNLSNISDENKSNLNINADQTKNTENSAEWNDNTNNNGNCNRKKTQNRNLNFEFPIQEGFEQIMHPHDDIIESEYEEELRESRALWKRLTTFFEDDGVAGDVAWRRVVLGAAKAPYYCGKTEDPDDALAVVFSFPPCKEFPPKETPKEAVDWLLRLDQGLGKSPL